MIKTKKMLLYDQIHFSCFSLTHSLDKRCDNLSETQQVFKSVEQTFILTLSSVPSAPRYTVIVSIFLSLGGTFGGVLMFGEDPGLLDVRGDPGLFVGRPAEPGRFVVNEDEVPSHFWSLQFWQLRKL